MKSRITFFSVAALLMLFVLYTNGVNAQKQKHPMAKMIGVWEMEAYKTEPAEVLNQMGSGKFVEMTFEWSADKQGVIHTNKGVINGETQYVTLTHFHDYKSNTGHILGAFGTGKTTYPDEKTVSIQQFSFEGILLNSQEFTAINEDEWEGFTESSNGLKMWVKMKRRK
ncbi:MAG: hypothetical protein HRU41_28085 [Saprospiraceae bacterium]|nr:hypothetical protein [Saprospiraceae bacterium]